MVSNCLVSAWPGVNDKVNGVVDKRRLRKVRLLRRGARE